MRKISLIALVILLVVPGLCWGQAKVGTAGVTFLKVGVSARAMGMAEAFIGVADDASALWYNPGGLMQLDEPDVILTHIAYPAGIALEYAGIAWPVPKMNGVFGAQITFLHTDEMIETTPERPFGTGRTFTVSDMSAGLTYSQKLTDKFSVGGTVKYLEERLADQKAIGVAFDVGTFYETGWKSVIIAMAITNFGPDMDFVNSPFPVPINFKFGGSMRLIDTEEHGLTLALEGSHPNDNLEQYNIGLEYGFMKTGFLRFGKKINGGKRYSWDEYVEDNEKDPFVEYPIINENGMLSTDGLCLGAGMKFNLPTIDLQIDYAFTKVEKLGSFSFFTLGIGL
ncbi:PorV/PorQ family protein [bacterium]|nr:PorV/PorQ family protein [bacterium]MBU1652128.1 PorV/PorQ family protein [bacterium]MBU1881743.1 PorV/PorQ family protein [bacterium]